MINFDVLNRVMDNDVDIIIAVFATYLEEHVNGLERINELYANENWPELHLLVHSLKGALESFGEDTAVTALQDIEEDTRNNVAPDESDITIVNRELLTINQQIFAYLDNLNSKPV
ncbi:Hpt domain-containing protein [Vibrio sp. J1-1]|uniref:Hpt domain-containing protein n=1 Tax=Vibrio sp. J1-1 TaxID=2912251 RepID=UPI001E0BEDDA|nr:Hpt domain-containing protein [Vibrio sp. J1-1]MBR9787431.1 Hpt domain-containing protein [Vibrionaceae bacterium]MCF7481076.1 Hpt domain-containing protein [Vibrio sp. J1-1]